MTGPAPTDEISPARTRLLVGLFVVVLGLVILVPNAWPVLRHWSASGSEAVRRAG